MRFTMHVHAGEFERFAPDVKLPESGQRMRVNMPGGSQREGELVHAKRVDAHRLEVTVEVPDVATTHLPHDVPIRFRDTRP